jgi:CBS domain-containing protein
MRCSFDIETDHPGAGVLRWAMNLLQACSHRIVTAKTTTTVVEAAKLMREHHVGSVIVMGDQVPVRPVGIVTDRDIAIKAVARPELKVASIEQIMSGKPVMAPGAMGLHEAIELMREQGVRRLLVTGNDGDLRGIISFDDVLMVIAKELNAMTQLIAAGMVNEERKTAR